MNDNNIEIIIETKELVHALGFASSIVEKKHAIAELGNIKLSAAGASLSIAATDMDIYLSQDIGVQVLNSGVTTVSTKVLAEIAKKIHDKEIKIKQSEDGTQLELIGKQCFFSLPTIPANQFPDIEKIDAKSTLRVQSADLVKLIEYTQFSISTEETRYNLNGVYFHTKGNSFCAATTDGHRLSLAATTLSSQSNEFGIILPRKTAQELLKIIKDSKHIHTDIEILLATNKVKFVCNNIIIISKLIDGQFPEYKSFIPQETPNKLTVNPKILAGVIDRVSTVTLDNFRAVKLVLNTNEIRISASGEAKGSAQEVLACSDNNEQYCVFEGNTEIIIGFNPKYLSDVLNTIKTDKLELHFNDAFSPVLITVPHNKVDSFVIMPVKV